MSEAVLLVCPGCRAVDEGVLRQRTLMRAGSVLRCACGRVYPIVAGIPVVVRDVRAWAESEGADALRDPQADPEVVSLLAVDEGSKRNRRLVAAYADPLPSDYSDALAEWIAQVSGPTLEMGAAEGHGGTVRLDLNLALLRLRPAVPLVDTADGVAVAPGGAVVADAADPPFAAEQFASVVLSNLLDSCRDPALVLAQADALLRPGGQLWVGCPFAFDEAITPVEKMFSEDTLSRALQGLAPFGPYAIGARLQASVVERAWRVRLGERAETRHRVSVFLATCPR